MKRGFEIGPIRPPSEASSLLVRVTRNCPWNRCRFCSLYRGQKFSPRSVEEIKSDIDEMYRYKEMIRNMSKQDLKDQYAALNEEEKQYFYIVYHWMEEGSNSAFLQDANSIVLKPDKLAEVVTYLKLKFPEIGRVTTYARADTLSRLSLDELKKLRQAGIDRVHSGFESGSDEVLKLINKGITKEQQILAGKNVTQAGMELSIYFMPGVGGKTLSKENALETADVINQVNPDFVRIRTFVVKKDTEIWYNVLEKQFVECTDVEKLQEIKLLIEKLENVNSIIKSDHIVNLLEGVEGQLPKDKEIMLKAIREFEDLNKEQRLSFQLARRMGLVRRPSDLNNLNDMYKEKINSILTEIKTENELEETMRELMRRYI